MNSLLIVGLIALLALIAVCVGSALWKRTKVVNFANANNAPNAARHATGRRTYLADGAIGRYKVVIIGSDEQHVAIGASATETPIGIAEDAADAAEDAISVALIPGCVGTTFGVAAAAIADGALVQSNGDGKVKTAVGTGYVIGRALNNAQGDGDLVEIAILYTGVALA